MSRSTEERSFLRYWNPANDPEHKDYSCYMALETFFYCLSPGNQWRSFYRTGNISNCGGEMSDMNLCMRVRAMHKSGRKEDAKDLLRKEKVVREESHVWRFRKHPPPGPWKSRSPASEP